MIVFSDLHLDEDSADVVLGQILPGISEGALRFGDPCVGCLGDFWNLRYKVDVKIQNAVRDELLRWLDAGLTFYVLPGNHDQVDVHGRNAMEVFDRLSHDGSGPNVLVFTEPTWTSEGLWVPYRKYYKDVVAALESPRPAYGCANVLWMHNGIKDAWMNDHARDTKGLPLSMFENFDAVILGHYHKRQTLGNAYYVGSPRQVTVHEAGERKGYATWDGQNLVYVDTVWGKRYHRVRLEPDDELKIENFKAGDDVRVSTAVGVDPEQVGQALASLGVQHTVTPDVPTVEQRLAVNDDATLREYARAYVDLIPTDLDRGRLLAVFEELTL
jgi:hypothetical protein